MRRHAIPLVIALSVAAVCCVAGVWAYAGVYGVHVLFRHGGTWWVDVRKDSAWISASMRLALAADPIAIPGVVEWRAVGDGLEVADLAAKVDGADVDHVLLARIDPIKFRFELRVAPDGDVGLDQWMARLHPALVINGSYSGRRGAPATPVVSAGLSLGPRVYDARAGAFVVSPAFTGLRDLGGMSWQAAFEGAENAMVSFPLLITEGVPGATLPSRWLANRTFIGQDGAKRIIIGTTTDAFFSLYRFGEFLHTAPLDLTSALNLDGGPVASQAIAFNGFERRSYGRWEAQSENDRVQLLMWPYGSVALPIVIAAYPR